MSQMREITTIIQNPNSDTSEKLNNGMKTDGVPQATIKQYSRTNSGSTTATKSDRNNNNVMNKSMPPPIPPKKPLKNGTFNKTNNNNATMHDNNNKTSAVSAAMVAAAEASTIKANGNSTSHTDVINHCHGPNTTPTTAVSANVLHKLSNPSNVADKNDGKGQCGRLNSRLDSDVGTAVVAQMNCIGDRKTASGCASTTTTSSDNHKKFNDDDNTAVTLTIATKCGSPNSGTSYHCDNGMTIIIISIITHDLIRFYSYTSIAHHVITNKTHLCAFFRCCAFCLFCFSQRCLSFNNNN